MKKILVFAAHPDDAETCVSGTIMHFHDQGSQIHLLNLTNKGGARTPHSEKCAELMGATMSYMDFSDEGEGLEHDKVEHLGVMFDEPHLKAVYDEIKAFQPDLILAHWPVDSHPDHNATGSLVLRASDLIRLDDTDLCPELWFYGPCTGYQSLCFKPDTYIDVTPYMERIKELYQIYNKVVPIMDIWEIDETALRYNGFQSGSFYAEGFIKCNFRKGTPRYQLKP